jgi:carbamoyl-phosphate synthase large subunit
LRQRLINPTAERLWYIGDAFRAGMGVDEIHELTAIDPWFLA